MAAGGITDWIFNDIAGCIGIIDTGRGADEMAGAIGVVTGGAASISISISQSASTVGVFGNSCFLG